MVRAPSTPATTTSSEGLSRGGVGVLKVVFVDEVPAHVGQRPGGFAECGVGDGNALINDPSDAAGERPVGDALLILPDRG
ncbi:hypothetical protein [Streptomyces sp. NPDC048473]|uniref:hypothetical protein n=1 Tax=unclassified Streptomyces TaxID=2593676 RepID=UPI00371D07CE